MNIRLEGPPLRRFRFGRGFGHFFGLLFLFRHPLLILVIGLIAFAVYLYRRRR